MNSISINRGGSGHMSVRVLATVVSCTLIVTACQSSPAPTQSPVAPTLAPSPPGTLAPAATQSAASTSARTGAPSLATAAIDGVYKTSFTRDELASSALLVDADEINDGNWGDFTMTFADGRVSYVQSNSVESSTSSGTFTVDGDAVTMAFKVGANEGETFGYRWSVAGDVLTLTRDDSLGLPGPTPFILKPWNRTGRQTPSPHVSGSPVQTTGRIFFNHQDTVTDTSTSFTINPDGTDKHEVGTGNVSCSEFTADGSTLGCTAWFETGGRPAAVYPDGSGLAVLNPDPDLVRSLECDILDSNRFICGAYPVDGHTEIVDRGLYLVSGFDGTDIARLTTTPEGCDDSDVVPSPDVTALLFVRVCGIDDFGTLYRVGVDGEGLQQLSPDTVSVLDSFGRLAADWSPDGSSIAYAAFAPAADSTALYVVGANGADARQIVPPEIGAVSAQWSSRGDSIAFTSRLRSDPQVWTVAPDGTNAVQVTDPADGSTSVAPVWSPDGSSLLFARLGGESTTLWTMAADGTSQKQIANLGNQESIGADWGSPDGTAGAMTLAEGGTIFPGTYQTAFEPGLTLTVGHVVDLDCFPGYRCRGDIDINVPNFVGLEFGNEHGAELDFTRPDQVVDPDSPSKLIDPPADLAAWVTALPGVTVLDPATAVVVGGVAGAAVSVEADADIQFGPTGISGEDVPEWFGIAARHPTRLILLHVHDKAVFITELTGVENFGSDFDGAVSGLQPVIDSIVWR
jgi:hypothetical protein